MNIIKSSWILKKVGSRLSYRTTERLESIIIFLTYIMVLFLPSGFLQYFKIFFRQRFLFNWQTFETWRRVRNDFCEKIQQRTFIVFICNHFVITDHRFALIFLSFFSKFFSSDSIHFGLKWKILTPPASMTIRFQVTRCVEMDKQGK